jgi:hypothetical protein
MPAKASAPHLIRVPRATQDFQNQEGGAYERKIVDLGGIVL